LALVASAQFDFTLATFGPQRVTQGRPLYFVVTATPVSGTSPTMIPITVAGLPAGATASFPDLAQTCCGTNQLYSMSSPVRTTIMINTLATTPVGAVTLTITVTAGTVARSVSYPITVTAPPNAFSLQPYAAASSVPQLALWESNMTTYGQTFCTQLTNTSLTFDQKLNTTYYDSQRVFYNIRDYTGGTTWETCALKAQSIYRDGYVTPNNGQVPGYWDFPHGIFQSYIRVGDTTSQKAVGLLSRNAAYGTSSVGNLNGMVSPALSREISYHLMAYLFALAAGEPKNPVGEAYLELTLGYIDQWFVSKNYVVTGGDVPPAAIGKFYTQPFMVGLAALIQYYETKSQDVRIPAAVKIAMIGCGLTPGTQRIRHSRMTCTDPPLGHTRPRTIMRRTSTSFWRLPSHGSTSRRGTRPTETARMQSSPEASRGPARAATASTSTSNTGGALTI